MYMALKSLAQKKKWRLSGGLSVYYRQNLGKNISVIEKNDHGLIWLKINQSIFKFAEDVYICHCYIPPSSSKSVSQNFDFFDEIEKGIERYNKTIIKKVFK